MVQAEPPRLSATLYAHPPAIKARYASPPGGWECCTCFHEDPDARSDYNPTGQRTCGCGHEQCDRCARFEFDLDDYMCPIKSTTPPAVKAMDYELDDISDYLTRRRVEEMRQVVSESVQRCYAALVRSRGNVKDALLWLAETRTETRPKGKLDAVDVVDTRESTSQVEEAGSLMLRLKQTVHQDTDRERAREPETEAEAPTSDDDDPIVLPSSRRKRMKTTEG
ncbi:DNA-dependent ATPase fun30 [Friedmanniomyces endolithicus]|uniref:DNA-dependent ATPase fun30 n=1 Tax=Friedmanniomyces endolithicus TaxID=329885 RepID=A0AAN6K119_9PEZI|nr:DNA-dependent ATPase fun30 [Friedmanniomyces endolithicus]KAK0836781.1 DNA-dependent ATPase fun30 [Friedmanniomyces endolithicus]KAK0852707.1 DNA-dependent ATPase fun30 [Friedmanniomyces endolithicus]KAK0872729.1 DNA-dependent ATPase fun30 [Friedmanniomyces endolithicus]KAK0893828.1 DNA-dependent ATPase fun30 [Friedmanniomyces endolithicus]